MSLRIALGNLKSRSGRTAALSLIAAVLSAVLFGGLVVTSCLKRGAEGLAARLGADLLIVAEGYDKEMEGILLRGEPTSFYMDADWLEKIASVDGVSAVTPQLYVATLNSSCCTAPVQLIGFDDSSDFLILPWIKTGLPSKLSQRDIVVGAMITGRVGDTVKFFNKDYRVAAKMASTGTGFDTSIFMAIADARAAALDGYEVRKAAFEEFGVEEDVPLPPPDGAISTIAVLAAEGATPTGILRDIQAKYGYNAGVVAVPANSIINTVSSGLRTVTLFIGSISIILWFVSVAALALVFSAMVGERKREFGLLRSIGAAKKKVAEIVLMESAAAAAVGSLTGIIAAATFVFPFETYLRKSINLPYAELPLLNIGLTALLAFLLSTAVGPLASLFSLRKILKIDTIDVIREDLR
jgi:putative ABC transport system permease protein